MEFKEKSNVTKLGEEVGFLISFLLFCSIFYLILGLLNKIPSYLKYVHIIIGVIVIYFLSFVLKKFVKK